MNIGTKLILSFLLVTFLPTILLAFLTTTIISSSMKDDAQQTLNSDLKAAWLLYYSRAYQMQYGMLQASTEFYIKNAVKNRDTEFLRGQLKAWKKYRPHVDLWAVVDDKAAAIASNNTEAYGFQVSINGLVEKAIGKKESFISTEIIPGEVLSEAALEDEARIAIADEAGDVSRGALRDGMFLTVVTPVTDESGEVLGAIITGDLLNNDTYVPDTFADTIPGTLLSISLKNVQISTNVFSEPGVRTFGHLVPPGVLKAISEKKAFRGEIEIARKRYITAFDPIRNHRGEIIGSLSVGIPKERFVELEYENIKAIVSIALIGLLLATGVASFITYLITRPIRVLTRKAHLVSAGNLDIGPGLPTEGNDEISDLAKAFDIMVKNLREHGATLSTQKNLIESIINSLPYCLYVLDTDLNIVVWNRHSSDVCPICRSSTGTEFYGVNFIRHLPDIELKDGIEDVIRGVFQSREPRSIERKATLKDPEPRDVVLRTTIFPILSGEKGVDYVVWMSEDITKKKAMEASVLSSEKLSAIGQLAAGMAHEVNNPLGGILNCLYNLKNKRLTEERKDEYLLFMEDGLKRVQNIVRQLLDFSQQHPPELALADINGMIEGLVPLFLHSVKSMKDRGVRLVKDLGEGLPPILVDKHQIEQVLVNLLLNAIQAVEGEGEGAIEISTRFEGSRFMIKVSDNGAGIPPENLPRIFDPFFTTKGVGKGTGLGLSVSRGIIERHGGRIEVESSGGRGTVFKVYLPVTPENV